VGKSKQCDRHFTALLRGYVHGSEVLQMAEKSSYKGQMWTALWNYFFPDTDQDEIDALIMNVEPERTPTLHDVMIDKQS